MNREKFLKDKKTQDAVIKRDLPDTTIL
jgi:hypothetical protein